MFIVVTVIGTVMTGIKDFYGKNTPLVSDWLRKAYRSCVSNLKALYMRYQYLSGGGGESLCNLMGENAISSWREIARSFWATGVFLGVKLHDHHCFWKRVFS